MIKRLGVVLFAKLQELAKGIAEGVSIVLQGNKKMEASSKKVSKSIEQSFGQGAKNAIKQTGEQMLIQTDILRDLEMGLKKLEEQQKATGKYDFQAQAKINKAIKEQTQAIADQKFALQGLKMQQQESKAALSESRAVAEDNSQAMEALSRAVNAAAMATLLLGDDNKKLQPAINAVRVVMAGASAAMALYNLSLRENNVLTMLSGKLQKAYAVVVGTSTGAMRMFRIALASTGVGVLVVALGALVAKLMETTEETSNLADEIERIDADLGGFKTKVENVASEWEHWMNVQIIAAKMAGKGEKELQKIRDEAYDNQIKNIEALIQETYNAEEAAQKAAKEQIKDQQELAKEGIKIFNKYEAERAKLDQDVFALRRKKELENLQLDYEISQEQKKINEDKLKSFLKAEQERQEQFKQYRAELLSEEKKFQQLSIQQMQEGKAKELAQLKFNFENEIAEVKYSQELKKALTDKYNKDVAAVNTKYSQQELEQIGANLTAYIKAQQAKREENKKTTKSITEENQRLNSQLISLQEQFYADMALTIGQAFAGGNPMEGLFKVMGNTFAMFLETIGRAMIALSGIAEAFKTIALTGAPALIAGVGLIAAAGFVRAKINNTPKFAKGGIVSGPTLGLMGEYPGASSNPEVIAPLDKLQSMLGGSADGSGFIAETRVSGRDLSIVLNRYNKEANRT
jgi:hypothetical protein